MTDKLKHVPPARQLYYVACVLMLVSALAAADDWPVHGGDPGGQRFSTLKEINRDNVKSLKVAWTYRTGDAYQPKNSRGTAFEATPLYVDGTLYLSTPLGRVIESSVAARRRSVTASVMAISSGTRVNSLPHTARAARCSPG